MPKEPSSVQLGLLLFSYFFFLSSPSMRPARPRGTAPTQEASSEPCLNPHPPLIILHPLCKYLP